MPNLETITMSRKELDRVKILEDVIHKRLSQLLAADQLSLSVRQVRRLHVSYLKDKEQGLISKRRGNRSNNRISDAVPRQIADTIREQYVGFNPTLAHEKLILNHACAYSRESVRSIMIEHGLWKGRSRRRRAIQQMRTRRSCFGELIQIDGSPHDWFEGRYPSCCLIVFIDLDFGLI